MLYRFSLDWLLIATLLYKHCFAATITSSASAANVSAAPDKGACAASCSIPLQFEGYWTWQAFTATTTYIHTVLLIVDEAKKTTKTVTTDIAVPASLKLVHGYGTNAQGTVTTSVPSGQGSTILAYPTPFVNYPDGYSVFGTYSSSGTCLTSPSIKWKSNQLAQLTQPAVTFPPKGDKFGTMYTLTEMESTYQKSFVGSRSKDERAFEVCSVYAVFPASAVAEALVLTTTSISTIKDTNPKPPPTPKPIPGTSPKGDTAPQSVVNNPAPTPIATTTPQVANIGSPSVVVSYQENIPPSGATTSAPPAIVIGTQTVVIGSTAIVNGVTVVATTGSDLAPQIVYGTTTVNVAPTPGVGSYIASGLADPSSSSGAQFTGGAERARDLGRKGLWCGFGFAILALLL